MSGREPEEAVGWPAVRQRWRSLTFVHWAVEPDIIDRLVPDGLTADLFDGQAWVGLTAFEVHDFGLRGGPAMPGAARFPETNLRTYVRTASGAEGVWFFSLEVASLANAVAGRLLGVPYWWARMSVTAPGPAGPFRYLSTRHPKMGRPASHDLEVAVDAEAQPAQSDLDAFLTGRWRAFSRLLGRLVTVPVQHQPWTLHPARILRLEEDLLSSAGIQPSGPPDHVCFSPGVDAVLGLPRPAQERLRP